MVVRALKVGNPYLARKFARFFRAPSTIRDFIIVRALKVGNPYLARKLFASFFRAPFHAAHTHNTKITFEFQYTLNGVYL